MRGKEALFIFRKAPGGMKRLIKARLIHGWLIVLPISALIMGTTIAFIPNSQPLALLYYTSLQVAMSAANVMFCLGYSLRSPVYTEKESMGNTMLLPMVSMVIFIPSLILLDEIYAPLAWLAGHWTLGLVMLKLGAKKVNEME